MTAYNEYRKSAKKTAYRTDLLGLHKGWLAFGVELDSFCERETSPQNATIQNVGMRSLISSKLYGVNRATVTNANCTNNTCTGTATLQPGGCTGMACTGCSCVGGTGTVNFTAPIPSRQGPGKNNFIGFGSTTCTGVTITNNTHYMQDTSIDSQCDLTVATYDMGVFGHLAGTEFASFEVDHNGVVDEQSGLTATITAGDVCAS